MNTLTRTMITVQLFTTSRANIHRVTWEEYEYQIDAYIYIEPRNVKLSITGDDVEEYFHRKTYPEATNDPQIFCVCIQLPYIVIVKQGFVILSH